MDRAQLKVLLTNYKHQIVKANAESWKQLKDKVGVEKDSLFMNGKYVKVEELQPIDDFIMQLEKDIEALEMRKDH